MKTRLLFLALLCAGQWLYAQEGLLAKKQYKPYDKYWQMDFSLGGNINLPESNAKNDGYLLATRHDVAPMFNFRATHLFSKRFGWYADTRISYFIENDANLKELPPGGWGDLFVELIQSIGDAMGKLFTSVHPSIDAGFIYRLEMNRLRIHPSVGLGFNAHLYNHTVEKSKTKNGVDYMLYYKQRPSSLVTTFGLTANYAFTNRSYLVLRTSYFQPLRKSYARMVYLENDVEKENLYYDTKKAGRNLNVSLGYGFTFGKR